MAFQKIAPQVYEVLFSFINQGLLTEKQVEQTSGISQRSLRRARCRFASTGSYDFAPSLIRGRPRELTWPTVQYLILVVRTYPDTRIHELIDMLAIFDIHVSRSTITRTLRQNNYTFKKLRHVAAERDNEARAYFRYVIGEFFANQLVFLDECRKDEKLDGRVEGWSLSGVTAEIRHAFGRGRSFSILPAMSIDGYLAVRIVEGSFDAAEFNNFVKTDLLPHLSRFPAPKSVLVMDNASIHHTQELADIVEAAGVRLVYLPPYSPDFNPIEESFGIIKRFIRENAADFRASTDPVRDLHQVCKLIDARTARNLFRHDGYI